MGLATQSPAGTPRRVHLFHHAFRKGGGKERYAIALASALKDLGCEVVVHTVRADLALAESLGIEVNLIKIPMFPRKLQDWHFYRQIEKVRSQVEGLQITLSRVRANDVLVSGGTHLGYLLAARKTAGPLDWLQLWLERRAYAFTRLIIAHSDLLQNDLVQHYHIRPEKIRTLYAPVDARFTGGATAPDRTRLRQRFGWPEHKTVFLFPSSGHRRKGYAPVCEALGSFSDQVLLAVAGKPPPGGAPPFAKHCGYIEDMAAAYAGADYTILGSLYEPFGLVGPESVLSGTRLVFEEKVGCLPAINPEFVFTFSVWDIPSIRHAIARAIELAQQRQHRIANPAQALRYDPSAHAHAAALLQASSQRP